MFPRPDLSRLTEAEKDALILALFDRLEAMEREIAALKAQLGEPPKTPDNSSLPPSKGQKANRRNKERRAGPRQRQSWAQGWRAAIELHARRDGDRQARLLHALPGTVRGHS